MLELVVARPWFTGRTTAAVLPRKIDSDCPTLLLDESDAAFNGDKDYAEALRGVLNTGHRRGGKATVCVGQGANIGFKDFSTFSPKAIAGIGKLPDTVADRAVPIRLDRRAPGERVERFRRREVEPQAHQIRQRLSALADVAVEVLAEARPDLPAELDDRAWDGIEPLLGIADLAGGDWPAAARAACVELYGGRQIEDESAGIQLLTDIKQVFGDRDRITTADLLAGLHALEESPWSDWFGKALTAPPLAQLLRSYGIKSKTIRLEHGPGGTAKGYTRGSFEEAWKRYFPPRDASKTSQRHNPHGYAESEGSVSVTSTPDVTDTKPRNPALGADCDGVTDRGRGEAGSGAQETLGEAWERVNAERRGEAA